MLQFASNVLKASEEFDGMSPKTELPRVRAAQDKGAGLREQILSIVSDPQSRVVSLPAKRARKLRHVQVTPDVAQLVPGPHDAIRRNGVRLVLDKKREARSSLVMSLGGTVLGAIAIGVMVGGVLASGKISAYGSHLLASTTAKTETAIDVDAVTAMLAQSQAIITQ